jgi:hypothetical protein
MSGITLWNPNKEPDKAGWDLAGVTWDKEEARTCLGWGLDMSDQRLWNPAKESDMSGSTGIFVCGYDSRI